jgi:hypothetical protein
MKEAPGTTQHEGRTVNGQSFHTCTATDVFAAGSQGVTYMGRGAQ